MTDRETAKKAAGHRAANLVEDGARIGLGTGSTARYALEEIARRIQEEGLQVVGTATSSSSERMARRLGIPLATLDDLEALDVAIDGADEVDPMFSLIKGRGAAHSREKVVASMAERFIVLVDESKIVARLGTRAPVPVEVLPMAVRPVERALERLGADVELRMGRSKDGPVVTDQGFWVLDASFDGIESVAELDRAIKQIPGVLDHGIFVGFATDVFVGGDDGSVRELEKEKNPAARVVQRGIDSVGA